MDEHKETITRTEKFKIAALISVAAFVFIMILWSSFEPQIQQLAGWVSEKIQAIFVRFNYASMMMTITLLSSY